MRCLRLGVIALLVLVSISGKMSLKQVKSAVGEVVVVLANISR